MNNDIPVELPLHTGKMLKEYFTKNRLSQAAFARKLQVTPKSVLLYFKNPDMRIQTLLRICTVLNYNFFADVVATLPPAMPPQMPQTITPQELQALKDENAKLTIEVNLLKEILSKSL